MRKHLHEVQEIDQYLLNTLPAADKLVFEARLLIDEALKTRLHQQQRAHRFIRWFGRRMQKERMDELHHLAMQDTAFKQSIEKIFS